MKKPKIKLTAEGGFDLLEPIRYFYCDEFDTNGGKLLAYNEESDPEAYKKSDRYNFYLKDPILQALSESVSHTKVYTQRAQLMMFKKYNYIKYLAEKARYGLTSCDLSELKDSDIRTWLICNNLAVDVRNRLISNNIKLLLYTITHVVERKRVKVEFEHVLSECSNKMFAILEGFNYTLNFQFSTYLYRSISNYINQLSRIRQREVGRYTHAGDTDHSMFYSTEDDKILEQSDIEYVQAVISTLDERSQHILTSRFGIGCNKMSLLELAKQYGVTKERIRQIELLALKNIRIQMSLNSKRYREELSHIVTY